MLTTSEVKRRVESRWTHETLAEFAVSALKAEALLAPKPGLVDQSNSGAHSDLTLELLLTSAESLRGTFTELADVGMAQSGPISQEFRDSVGVIGRAGEAAMLEATRGVNTHRGALWSLGLLVVSAAALQGSGQHTTERQLTNRVAAIAALTDSHTKTPKQDVAALRSHGENARIRYGARGARGQAQAGLPGALVGVASLRTSAAAGWSPEDSRLIALLSIISTLDDTCLLHRGGVEGLAWFQDRATELLHSVAVGLSSSEFRTRLTRLDREAIARRLSPGGSADLLSAALLIDRLGHAPEPADPLRSPFLQREDHANADLRLPGY